MHTYNQAESTETTTMSRTSRPGWPRVGLHGNRPCKQQTQAPNTTHDPHHHDNDNATNNARANNDGYDKDSRPKRRRARRGRTAHSLPSNRWTPTESCASDETEEEEDKFTLAPLGLSDPVDEHQSCVTANSDNHLHPRYKQLKDSIRAKNDFRFHGCSFFNFLNQQKS